METHIPITEVDQARAKELMVLAFGMGISCDQSRQLVAQQLAEYRLDDEKNGFITACHMHRAKEDENLIHEHEKQIQIPPPP